MIIFLNLKDQINDGLKSFCFYNTVCNTLCMFGEDKQIVFNSIDEFKSMFDNKTISIDRFLNLIPNNYFNSVTPKYNKLLAKYIQYVRDVNGYDFTQNGKVHGSDIQFGDDEWNVLTYIHI